MSKIKATVGTKISVQVLRGGNVQREYVFHNIITNVGLSSWRTSALPTSISIGQGVRSEDLTVTALQSYTRNFSGTWAYFEPNYLDEINGVVRTTYQMTALSPVETSAQNYTELGLGANNSLWTYATIKDPAGLPTAVTVLAGEQIRVFYQIQFSIPVETVINAELDGTPTVVTVVPFSSSTGNSRRLPPQSNYFGVWQGVQPVPTAKVMPSGRVTAGTVTTDASRYKASLSISQGNYAEGIGMVYAGPSGASATDVGMFFHFDPPVPKQSGEILNFLLAAN